MIIIDLSVRKMDHADPRYPDPMPERPFTDVYLLTAKTDDGEDHECPFFLTDLVGEMTPSRTADMLKLFAAAIAKMGDAKKAA